MSRLNRDAVTALVLLVIIGAFFAASFEIRETAYATIGADVWPRLILAVMLVLTLIYLAQSLRKDDEPRGTGTAAGGLLVRYQNAFWCYALFGLFLVTLPVLGMLLGGILFVFLALTVMGERTPHAALRHAAIAIGTIGVMWAIFTFGLGVFLPEGRILRIW